MSTQKKNWNYYLSEIDSVSLPEPLGFNAGSQDMVSSKAQRREVIEMKQNRARDLTMSQAKGIFTSFLSPFFIGRSISLFTIMVYGYQFYNSFSNIINVNNAFKYYIISTLFIGCGFVINIGVYHYFTHRFVGM